MWWTWRARSEGASESSDHGFQCSCDCRDVTASGVMSGRQQRPDSCSCASMCVLHNVVASACRYDWIASLGMPSRSRMNS